MPTPTPSKPYPWFTEERLTYALKLLLVIVLALYLLGFVFQILARVQSIVILLIGAIFFAYLIYPLVRWLNVKLPLIAAVLIVYAAIVLVVFGAGWLIVPGLIDDGSSLVHAYPTIVQKIDAFVNDPSNPVLRRLPQPAREGLAHLPEQIVAWGQLHGVQAAEHALTVLMSTFALLATFIIIPVLAAYMLVESEHIKRVFLGLIPKRGRENTLDILSELEDVIGGFIRGQLLVGGSVGIIIMIPLLLMHVPYAILIGVLAGLLDVIPYIGPVIAFVPAFLIALLNNGALTAVFVAVVFVAANQLEGHLIAPNIVSRTIKLRPLAVILAILIGGEVGGVLGMFVAVPAAGILRVLLKRVLPPIATAEEAKPVLTSAPRDTVEGELEVEGKIPS